MNVWCHTVDTVVRYTAAKWDVLAQLPDSPCSTSTLSIILSFLCKFQWFQHPCDLQIANSPDFSMPPSGGQGLFFRLQGCCSSLASFGPFCARGMDPARPARQDMRWFLKAAGDWKRIPMGPDYLIFMYKSIVPFKSSKSCKNFWFLHVFTDRYTTSLGLLFKLWVAWLATASWLAGWPAGMSYWIPDSWHLEADGKTQHGNKQESITHRNWSIWWTVSYRYVYIQDSYKLLTVNPC